VCRLERLRIRCAARRDVAGTAARARRRARDDAGDDRVDAVDVGVDARRRDRTRKSAMATRDGCARDGDAEAGRGRGRAREDANARNRASDDGG